MQIKVKFTRFMKRTPDDDAFAADFSKELQQKYAQAKERGVTDEQFSESIGVKRAQLDKYLQGTAMPSVRTVVLAYRNHQIAIPYAQVKTDNVMPKAGKERKEAEGAQLSLPFTIRAEGSETVNVKFRALSARTFELQLLLKRR